MLCRDIMDKKTEPLLGIYEACLEKVSFGHPPELGSR